MGDGWVIGALVGGRCVRVAGLEVGAWMCVWWWCVYPCVVLCAVAKVQEVESTEELSVWGARMLRE